MSRVLSSARCLTAILAELGLELKQAKARIAHLKKGGEGVDFLGFHHRWARGNTPRSRHLCFLVRWPSPQAPQRYRVREITDRRRLLVPVEDVVQDLNRFLRGWSGYSDMETPIARSTRSTTTRWTASRGSPASATNAAADTA